MRLGLPGDALVRYESALACRRAVLPPEHLSVAQGMLDLATAHRALGQWAAAAQHASAAQAVLGPDHPRAAAAAQVLHEACWDGAPCNFAHLKYITVTKLFAFHSTSEILVAAGGRPFAAAAAAAVWDRGTAPDGACHPRHARYRRRRRRRGLTSILASFPHGPAALSHPRLGATAHASGGENDGCYGAVATPCACGAAGRRAAAGPAAGRISGARGRDGAVEGSRARRRPPGAVDACFSCFINIQSEYLTENIQPVGLTPPASLARLVQLT